MGITDFLSDLWASAGYQEAHAEAPTEAPDEAPDEDKSQEEGGEEGGDGKSEEAGEEPGSDEGGDERGGGEGGEEEGGEEAEEEEKEDDEPVDPKPKLEEECARSAQCAPYRHHYEECVERVTAMQEDPDYKGPKEDCVEEFFHLQHCASSCAAPKLFRGLK